MRLSVVNVSVVSIVVIVMHESVAVTVMSLSLLSHTRHSQYLVTLTDSVVCSWYNDALYSSTATDEDGDVSKQQQQAAGAANPKESKKIWHYRAHPKELREGERPEKGPYSLQVTKIVGMLLGND